MLPSLLPWQGSAGKQPLYPAQVRTWPSPSPPASRGGPSNARDSPSRDNQGEGSCRPAPDPPPQLLFSTAFHSDLRKALQLPCSRFLSFVLSLLNLGVSLKAKATLSSLPFSLGRTPVISNAIHPNNPLRWRVTRSPRGCTGAHLHPALQLDWSKPQRF